MLHARLVRSQDLASTVKYMETVWIPLFGAPHILIGDNAYASSSFKTKLLDDWGIKVVNTAPYYPESNGMNERSHAILENIIKRIYQTASESTTNFEKALAIAVANFNSTVNSSTNRTPAEALYGKNLVLPCTQEIVLAVEEEERAAMRTEWSKRQLVKFEQLTKLQNEHDSNKLDLSVGDTIIYYRSENERSSSSQQVVTKLNVHYNPNWSLPCTIVELSNKSAKVKDIFTNVIRVAPLTRIRKFNTTKDEILRVLNALSIINTLPTKKELGRETIAQKLQQLGLNMPSYDVETIERKRKMEAELNLDDDSTFSRVSGGML